MADLNLPETVEAGQAELEQITQLLGNLPAVQQRAAFLSGWLAAQDALEDG